MRTDSRPVPQETRKLPLLTLAALALAAGISGSPQPSAALAAPLASPEPPSGFIEVELDGTLHRFDRFGPNDAGFQASQLGGLLSIEASDADGATFRIMTSNIDLAALELPADLQAEDMAQFEARLGRRPEPSEVTKLRMIGLVYRNAEGRKFANGLPKPTLTIEQFDGKRIRGRFVGVLDGRKAGKLEMVDGRFDVVLGGQ